MLQSEFFERTKVNLTVEEYHEVEQIYDSVQMDKDEFCQLWLKNRENKIIAELMVTIKKLENDCQELKDVNKDLTDKLESKTAEMESELKDMSDTYKCQMEEFGRKMVIHFEDDTYRYDDIAEEFGLDFIIRVKLENDYDLEKGERDHIIKKL